MLTRLQKLYHQFPSRFWVIVLALFIDSIGGTLLFPFFSLYITEKFNVGMTQAGMVLATFSIFGVIGNMIGGALTDRFGRKKLILFGLISAHSARSRLAWSIRWLCFFRSPLLSVCFQMWQVPHTKP